MLGLEWHLTSAKSILKCYLFAQSEISISSGFAEDQTRRMKSQAAHLKVILRPGSPTKDEIIAIALAYILSQNVNVRFYSHHRTAAEFLSSQITKS